MGKYPIFYVFFQEKSRGAHILDQGEKHWKGKGEKERMQVVKIGVWEGEDGFAAALSRVFPVRPVVGRHPAAFSEGYFDLLLVSPEASGWAGAGIIDCRAVLLPGMAGPLARVLRADSAVSYGGSAKDTLTISSLEGSQICVALQREILTLGGATLDRQEFVLPFPPGEDPNRFLALTGAKLLLTGRA